VDYTKKYRLIVKCNFDGLVSAVLLKYLNIIDEIVFSHPRDLVTGKVNVTSNDITVGLPYRESARLAFDNYQDNSKGIRDKNINHIIDTAALSVTRIVYNYFGGKKKFPQLNKELLTEADRGYNSRYTTNEILYPSNWELLSYLVDQATGLEKFKKFQTPYDQLMLNLVDRCKDHTILEILNLPDVEERIDAYFTLADLCKFQILRHSTVHYNLVITDLRKEQYIYPGNRFITYAVFPECNVSLHATSDLTNDKTTFIVGKSIVDRSYRANIGKLLARFGGGGHANAGTCQVNSSEADRVLGELMKSLKYGLLKNLILGYFH